MKNKPFLPFDWCRCDNEKCSFKDNCLRYLTKDMTGPRTAFFIWDNEPDDYKCDSFIAYIPTVGGE